MIKENEEKKRAGQSCNAKAWLDIQDAIHFVIANNEEARERQSPRYRSRKEARLLLSIAERRDTAT